MARPRIIVNISAALPRRGQAVETGRAFFAFSQADSAGPVTPVRCTSRAAAADAFGSAPIVDLVADALAGGAPEVVLVRAVPGTNEVQTVTVSGSPTGGTFALTFAGQTTSDLPHNATAAAVRTALTALSTVGANNVTVSGAAGGPYTVTFQGDLGDTDVPVLVADSSDLTGGSSPSVAVTTPTAGVPVTEAAWDAALAKLTATFGPGQVAIPGVSTTAAHNALLTHGALSGRTALLDGEPTATAGEIVTLATAQSASPAATNAGLIAPSVTVAGPAGTTRVVPGSVVAAGLVARGDAVVGHANQAPAHDQGRAAGTVVLSSRVTGVTARFTDAEWDTLDAAGVSLIVPTAEDPAVLSGWRSLSADSRFRQLNIGRLIMQLSTGLDQALARFLSRQIDGRGHLYAEVEGALRGYLLPLYDRDALYGAEPDDAFDVAVASVNTPELAAAGQLKAAIEITPSKHTETITLDVTVQTAGATA